VLISGDTAVAGSHDGRMFFFNAHTGDTLAMIPAGRQLSSAAASDSGDLVVGMGGPLNRLSVFPDFDSSREWSGSAYFAQPCYSSPAIYGNIAVIGANDGILRAIHLVNRTDLWQVHTNGEIYLSTPAISNDVVYFAPGDMDRAVYAVDLYTGNVRWRSWGNDIAPEGFQKGLAKEGRTMAAPELSRYLERLSPLHRQRVMESMGMYTPPPRSGLAKSAPGGSDQPVFLPAGGGVRTSSVAVDTSGVYVVQQELGNSGDAAFRPIARYTLLCLDAADGRERWRFAYVGSQLGPGYCSSPVVTQTSVFFGWADGRAYALDVNNGEVQWQDSLDGNIISSPAIAGNNILFATAAGTICCFACTQSASGIDFQQSTFCFPNPARGLVSNVQTYVGEAADMAMTIYSTSDKPVLRMNRQLAAGEKFVYKWDLRTVANGVYFARIRVTYAGGREEKKTVKIAVLR
jgi:outer membrane protein assembly factor BamB